MQLDMLNENIVWRKLWRFGSMMTIDSVVMDW